MDEQLHNIPAEGNLNLHCAETQFSVDLALVG